MSVFNNVYFNDLLIYLLGKWKIYLIVIIIGVTSGVAYSFIQKVQYQSRLTFSLDDGNDDLAKELLLASQFGIDLTSRKEIFTGDNIFKVLKSRKVIEETLLTSHTFNSTPSTLANYFLKVEKINNNNYVFPLGSTRNNLSAGQRKILFKLYEKITKEHLKILKPDKTTGLYEISFISSDEVLTKIFTDNLIHITDVEYQEICAKKSTQAIAVLEERIENLRNEISASISGKAIVKDINLNPVYAIATAPVEQQNANIQTFAGSYSEMFNNLEVLRYKYLKQLPLIQIIDNADYPMKQIKISHIATGIWFGYIGWFFCIILLTTIHITKRLRIALQ